MTATLTPFARAIRQIGPIEDGIVLTTAPALADSFPDVVDVGLAPRRVRPLAVRIAEEEARLARREVDLDRARRALARMDALAAELGAPDRAGAMRRDRDAARANARMDAGLARYVRACRRVTTAHGRVVSSRARLRGLLDRAAVEAADPHLLAADVEAEQSLHLLPRTESNR